MSSFFKTIKASLWSPEFYQKTVLEKRTFGQAFGYFAAVSLLGAFVFSTLIMGMLSHELPFSLKEGVQKVGEIYPDELVITFEEGRASINMEEPLFLTVPEEWMTALELDSSEAMNLAVIDTQTPFGLTQFEEYNTLAWLTQDSLFYVSEENGEVSGFPVAELGDTTMDKERVEAGLKIVSGFTKWIFPAMVVILTFALFLFNMIWGMLYLLFLAALISIMRAVLDQSAGYGESYRTGLYAMTILYGVNLGVMLLSNFTGFQRFPLLTTVLVMAVLFMNFRTVPTKSK